MNVYFNESFNIDIETKADLEKQFNIIVDKLEKNSVINLNKLKIILKICDELLIKHILDNMFIIKEEEKIKCQEYIESIIVEILNRNYNNQKIGDILIKECLAKHKIVGYTLLIFDFYRVAKEHDLEYIKPQIRLRGKENDCLGRADEKVNIAEINISFELFEYEDEVELNTENMHTIRHEINHFIQYRKIKEKRYKNRLEELYYEFNNIAHNIDNLYYNMHDYFPSEYDCNEFGYEMLMKLLTDYDDDYALSDYIEYVNDGNYYTKTFEDVMPIGIGKRSLYHTDNYNIDYPNCNLLPIMYELIKYQTEIIRTNINNINYKMVHNLYRMIKIAQEVLNYFPNYYEKYIMPIRLLSLEEIDPVFIDFNYHNVLEGKLNIKKTFLNSKIGLSFMEDYGYYTKSSESIINEFTVHLLLIGYTTEQIEKLYKSCYEKYKETLDFLYFINYLKEQTKHRKLNSNAKSKSRK